MTEQYLANLKTYRVNLPELAAKMQVTDQKESKTTKEQQNEVGEDRPIHPSFFDLNQTNDIVTSDVIDEKIETLPSTETFLSKLKNKMLANEKNISCTNVPSVQSNPEEFQILKYDLSIDKKKLSKILQTNIHRKRIQDLLFQKDNLQGLEILIQKKKNSVLTRIGKKFCVAYNNGHILDIEKEYSKNVKEFESQSNMFEEKMKSLHEKQHAIDLELEKLILSPIFDDFLTKLNQLFHLEILSFS